MLHFPLNPSFHRRRIVCAAAQVCTMALLAGMCAPLYALPASGQVTNGSASIASHEPNKLTITQTSANATINWQSFNIGATESVRFVQPNSNSVTLNRVMGSDPSHIFGSLSANGQVFLINPHGVLFGNGATVNVGGLVASTLEIADADFLARRYRFEGNASGEVRNQGNIQAQDGGYVALLGNSVANKGAITAGLGTVALAAGGAIALDIAGDGLLNIAINQDTLNALVLNSGLMQADGGMVWMSASARNALLTTVVNNTGVVQANSVGYRHGRIVLDGGDTGVVSVSGALNAMGTEATSSGGEILISGDKLSIMDGARLDATGSAGGGSIAVGGGWQGQDPRIRHASGVYVAAGATLDASATRDGNGGTVVAWSDVQNPLSSTRVYGTLRARGGAQAGHGGRIETSGHWLDVRGVRLDASAPHGQGGQWLLDPEDLIVGTAPTDAVVSPPMPFVLITSGTGTPNVLNTDIENQLNAGTSVILQTAPTGTGSGNISVNANIAKTAGGAAALTLQAHGSISLGAGVSISASVGSLDIDLLAGGSVILGTGSSIASNGGDIVVAGASLINNAGAGVLNTSGGAGGRWIVYTSSPLTDAIGGLNSGNPAIWSQDPGSLPPPSIDPGNWFVYASANPITAVTQTVGGMASTTSTNTLALATNSDVPPLLELDPPNWLLQDMQAGVNAFLPSASADASATSTTGPGEKVGAVGTGTPLAGQGSDGAASLPSRANAPLASRFRSAGFSGLPKPSTSPSTASAGNRSAQEAFLRGAVRTLQVGTSSSGSMLLAAFSGPGKPLTMTVTVAPTEGFRIAIPTQFLQQLQPDRRTPSVKALVNGGALPAWLRFEPTTGVLRTNGVPANALPLTVRVLGAIGKFADITLQ